MSRRKDKADEEFAASTEASQREVGIEIIHGYALREQRTRRAYEGPANHFVFMLGVIEVRCNRCDHRIDSIKFGRPSLFEPAEAASRYASGFRIHIGESPKWPQGPKYGCRRCGRSGLLLSMRRVEEFFTALDAASPAGTIPEAVERQVVRL